MKKMFAVFVPLVLVAAFAGIQPAAGQTFESWARPDAQVRGGPADQSYVGDDIYNHNARRQTVQRIVRPGYCDQFNVMLENDGEEVDSFIVRGMGSTSKFRVTYWYGPLNVTDDVVRGVFESGDIEPGDADYLMLDVCARTLNRQGTTRTTLVSAMSTEEHVWDTVGARLKVDKHAGDFGSQRPI